MMLEQVICLNCLLAIQASDTLMPLVLKYTPEEKKKSIFNTKNNLFYLKLKYCWLMRFGLSLYPQIMSNSKNLAKLLVHL